MNSFAIPIITALSGIAGGFLNKNKTDTSGPTGASLDLLNTLQNYYGQAMKTTPDFMNAYETGGLNSIKTGADMNAAGIANINASHGVRGPAAAYASTVPRVAAQSQVANLQTSLPMVRSQYQNQIMDRALNGVNAGRKSVTMQGSPTGGVFGNLATTLAGMYGMQAPQMGQYFPVTQGMGNGPGVTNNPVGLQNLPTTDGYYIPGGGN